MNIQVTVFNIPLSHTSELQQQNYLRSIAAHTKTFHNEVHIDFPHFSEIQIIILKRISFSLFTTSSAKLEIGLSLPPL